MKNITYTDNMCNRIPAMSVAWDEIMDILGYELDDIERFNPTPEDAHKIDMTIMDAGYTFDTRTPVDYDENGMIVPVDNNRKGAQ